jgi:hypothetical protein
MKNLISPCWPKHGRTKSVVKTLLFSAPLILGVSNTASAAESSKVIDVKEFRNKGILGTTKDFSQSLICTYWKVDCTFDGETLTKMHPPGRGLIPVSLEDYHLNGDSTIKAGVLLDEGHVTSGSIGIEGKSDAGLIEKLLYSIAPSENHAQASDVHNFVRVCTAHYDKKQLYNKDKVTKYKGKSITLSCSTGPFPHIAFFTIGY